MKKLKITEAQIRDFLSEHLTLIEPSLELVGKEFYLPNTEGASGFLDIFARDSNGKLVIIEIKRTDSAAREAIQELYKYVSLIRKNLLVKDIEIRLILLSVQWHELESPFSEFYASAPFEVTAGKIILDEKGTPIAITPLLIQPTSNERKIGIRHFLWGFPDEAAAKNAIPLIEIKIKKSGLKDFVLIKSTPTNKMLAGRSFIYFAQRELRLEEYLELIEINSSEKQFSEFKESLDELTELDDKIAEASDEVWLGTNGISHRQFGADTAEISSLEKGRGWFELGAQDNIQIYRFGRFVDDWLDDATIIKEIRGEDGSSTVLLDFVAHTNSPPEMKALSERVDNVFFYNEAWQGTVHQLIRYAKQKPGHPQITIRVFSPEDVLRSIAALAFGYQGYSPIFNFDIEYEGNHERFIGFPEWDGSQPDFDKVINEHFWGDIMGYFTSCHFGENRTINHDVMTALGLRYSVFSIIDNNPQRIRVQGSSIIPVKGEIRFLNRLVVEHHDAVMQLAEKFMSIDNGFADVITQHYMRVQAEHCLAEIIENGPHPKSEIYWNGEINKCDLCDYPFSSLEFMIDAIFTGGFGANICAHCFLQQGLGIGMGRGQIYKTTPKGWLYIAG